MIYWPCIARMDDDSWLESDFSFTEGSTQKSWYDLVVEEEERQSQAGDTLTGDLSLSTGCFQGLTLSGVHEESTQPFTVSPLTSCCQNSDDLSPAASQLANTSTTLYHTCLEDSDKEWQSPRQRSPLRKSPARWKRDGGKSGRKRDGGGRKPTRRLQSSPVSMKEPPSPTSETKKLMSISPIARVPRDASVRPGTPWASVVSPNRKKTNTQTTSNVSQQDSQAVSSSGLQDSFTNTTPPIAQPTSVDRESLPSLVQQKTPPRRDVAIQPAILSADTALRSRQQHGNQTPNRVSSSHNVKTPQKSTSMRPDKENQPAAGQQSTPTGKRSYTRPGALWARVVSPNRQQSNAEMTGLQGQQDSQTVKTPHKLVDKENAALQVQQQTPTRKSHHWPRRAR